ncbi:MAG: hypothetical protein GX025_00875 [Clostridiales bacterium]|nr:hypothetical protein [Clostridiales bacterium]
MKKLLVVLLLFSLAFMTTGCNSPEEELPAVGNQSENSPPAVSTEDSVFDENGNIILDENGQIDMQAAINNIDSYTTEEVLKIAHYRDGALATAVNFTLGRRLLKDFDTTLSQIAMTEIPEDRGGTENLGFGMGYEIGLDLQSEAVSVEDCKILYAEHELTDSQQAVLDKIIEGFESAQNN